jgi:hypothetical protein
MFSMGGGINDNGGKSKGFDMRFGMGSRTAHSASGPWASGCPFDIVAKNDTTQADLQLR